MYMTILKMWSFLEHAVVSTCTHCLISFKISDFVELENTVSTDGNPRCFCEKCTANRKRSTNVCQLCKNVSVTLINSVFPMGVFLVIFVKLGTIFKFNFHHHLGTSTTRGALQSYFETPAADSLGSCSRFARLLQQIR